METQQWRKLLLPYQQAVKELIVKFESIQNEYNMLGEYSPIEFVNGRVKKISSILDKVRKKKISLDKIEKEIEDIAGIRIICQFVEDIDKVVELIKVRDGKDLKIIKEKDYLKNTKDSGYRSYHIIIEYPVQTALGEAKILAEIQIRTLAMNFWATIEHSLRYKYKGKVPQDIHSRLLKASVAAFLLDTEMSQIRSEVIEAQNLFRVKSNVVADILNNIQNLYKYGNVKDVQKIQEQFIQLWEKGNIEKLIEFNKQLDAIVEVYDAQSLTR